MKLYFYHYNSRTNKLTSEVIEAWETQKLVCFPGRRLHKEELGIPQTSVHTFDVSGYMYTYNKDDLKVLLNVLNDTYIKTISETTDRFNKFKDTYNNFKKEINSKVS